MTTAPKRKISLSLDAAVPEAARDPGITVSVSAVADTAPKQAVAEARRRQWLDENAAAFAAQADWHDRNGHPLAQILATPGKASWTV